MDGVVSAEFISYFDGGIVAKVTDLRKDPEFAGWDILGRLPSVTLPGPGYPYSENSWYVVLILESELTHPAIEIENELEFLAMQYYAGTEVWRIARDVIEGFSQFDSYWAWLHRHFMGTLSTIWNQIPLRLTN